ncbi:unnamed protein product [Litomosoides sigmodontis]|uniref:Uncharacterized protein n=1 Tax=Litomosoides sigmodontis TaxID=42156 RepID=A0A3P6TCI2_LITSI|nr:unnamed protein product [Litomosoides sigmodontis]
MEKKLPDATPFNYNYSTPTNSYGATFINTDGIFKSCISHVDCYSMREPIYWCRLYRNQRWTEKGCYCDSIVKACIIERFTTLGPIYAIRNYALCVPKKSWKCPKFI